MTFDNLINIFFNRSNRYANVALIICYLAFILLLSSCTTLQNTEKNVVDTIKPRNIFVFMDGTANNPEIPTNVSRLHQEIEEISRTKDPNTKSLYIEGVGNAEEPLIKLAGQVAGFGMEAKILEGYKFIAQHYRPGDHIYIFGFSRGAHTARSLAGLISYAGVPKLEDAEQDSIFNNILTSGWNNGNKILELTKKQIDINHTDNWSNWKRGDPPILGKLIKNEIQSMLGSSKNIEVQPAEVEFLGVWDTVPGSQGIGYFDETDLVCKQNNETTDNKQRYQLDSYPPIHHIAHAISKDEKRDQFKPLFLCSKQVDPDSVHNEELTKLDEMVFPGAHADVGGGYEHKNNQLPDISLEWMVGLLGQHYSFLNINDFIDNKLKPNPKGLANLSISSSNVFHCIDRELPSTIASHESVLIRDKTGAVPWLYFKQKPKGNYPEQSCKDWVDPIDEIETEKLLCISQSSITCSNLGYD